MTRAEPLKLDPDRAEPAADAAEPVEALTDITIQTYDCDLAVAGTDRVYYKALLVGITEPDGDSSSGAPATFAMTFAIQDVESK